MGDRLELQSTLRYSLRSEPNENHSYKMDQRSKWMIASKIKTNKLLAAVNSIAALAILFFGAPERSLKRRMLKIY